MTDHEMAIIRAHPQAAYDILKDIDFPWPLAQTIIKTVTVRFDFSPCVNCGGCDLSDTNEEDCFGNPFPVCGDCLWARNVIVCP